MENKGGRSGEASPVPCDQNPYGMRHEGMGNGLGLGLLQDRSEMINRPDHNCTV